MRRLFISLYLSIAAALFVIIIVVPFTIERGLQGPLLAVTSKYADTPRAILEQELAGIPQSEWPSHIDSLREAFGYDIKMQRLDEIDERKVVLRRLRRGDVAIATDGDDEAVFLPMRGSDFVIRASFAASDLEQTERFVKGFYYLIEKRLQGMGREERAHYFRDMSSDNSILMKEDRVDALGLQADELALLQSGHIVGRVVEGDADTFFKAVAGTDKAIVIGPIRDGWLLDNLNWIALSGLGLIFAVAAFLWLRPLIIDMQTLEAGTTAFGHGDFDARVSVSGRSKIRELASTFNSMAKRIKALIGAQKELTDSVSHELRTPIFRLRFGMFRLENCNSHEERQRAINGMRADVDELDQLVDELLTYSRLKSANPALATRTVEVQPWLGQIAADANSTNDAVNVSSKVDSGLMTVEIDGRLMSRAMNNLVRNASRYARSQVIVSARRSKNGVQLLVEDDGDGISEDLVERVFEPFVRLEEHRNGNANGYGLGLAIVKRICEWHGATVRVSQSSIGGAKFIIEITV
jgi:signal transduction histidine kinase